jgi:hypothetical protein
MIRRIILGAALLGAAVSMNAPIASAQPCAEGYSTTGSCPPPRIQCFQDFKKIDPPWWKPWDSPHITRVGNVYPSNCNTPYIQPNVIN